MIKVDADLDGISSYAGGIAGMLEAIEEPNFQGDFTTHVMKSLRKRFMADTIAVHMAGNTRIQHVFEWPAQDASGVSTGQPNPTPLFKLNIRGSKGVKMMDFTFLPSTVNVPLPDPERYGFSPSKLQYLRRHTFVMKAAVMETQNQVTIYPRKSKRLFIPDAGVPKGYFMTERGQTINPGGGLAVGGFSEWWTMWFTGPAQIVVDDISRLTSETIGTTGQKVARYAAGTVIDGTKVGGQFARSRPVSVAYADGYRRAFAEMKKAGRMVLEDEYEEGEE